MTEQKPGYLPSKVEQAKEKARDDLTLTELCNMIHDLPCVLELIVDGEADGYRETRIIIGFKSENGAGTDDIATIMRRAGWTFDGVTFCMERMRFRLPGSDQEGYHD